MCTAGTGCSFRGRLLGLRPCPQALRALAWQAIPAPGPLQGSDTLSLAWRLAQAPQVTRVHTPRSRHCLATMWPRSSTGPGPEEVRLCSDVGAPSPCGGHQLSAGDPGPSGLCPLSHGSSCAHRALSAGPQALQGLHPTGCSPALLEGLRCVSRPCCPGPCPLALSTLTQQSLRLGECSTPCSMSAFKVTALVCLARKGSARSHLVCPQPCSFAHLTPVCRTLLVTLVPEHGQCPPVPGSAGSSMLGTFISIVTPDQEGVCSPVLADGLHLQGRA